MAKKLGSKRKEEQGLSFDDHALLRGASNVEHLLEQALHAEFGKGPGNPKASHAQELVYQALDERSSEKRARLAREALEVYPDCADAYVLLGEQAANAQDAIAILEQGVAAGERALGKEAFQENQGHFWGLLETRPYMRAKAELVRCLWALGRRDEAVEHCIEMLRLNPNDNQGMRYVLASFLLDLGRDDELAALLGEYDETSAEWLYSRAILEFRKSGEGPRANKALLKASEENPHVGDYLLGLKVLPPDLPDFITPGGENEAISYTVGHLAGWRSTPGALAWMRKILKAPLPEAPRRATPSWPQLAKKLALLPFSDAAWQVDIRPLSAVVEGTKQAASPWMVLVTCPDEDEILVVEMEPSRPDAKQVWEFVVNAMLRPKEREPVRPRRIEVRLKSFWTPWRKKLSEVGIECLLEKSLAHIDQVLVETIAPLAPAASGNSPASVAVDLPLSQLAQDTARTWQADVRRLPIWVGDDGEPRRPWSALVADLETTTIIAQDIRVADPTPDWLAENVLKAMRQPAYGRPHRPGVVQVSSPAYAQALEARLSESGVAVELRDNLPEISAVFNDLGSHLSGPDKIAPLLEVPGVGPHEAGEYFAAAAEFYQQAPWRHIPGDSVLQVECSKYQSGPWYAVVMGQSGLTYGLAIYEGLDVLREILRDGHSQQGARHTSALSLTYGEEFEMPIPDLDAIESHGWPVAAPEAYPSVMRVNPGFVTRPPLVWELELVEGCLRAIPEFVRMRGRKSAKFTVGVASGDVEISLSRVEDV